MRLAALFSDHAVLQQGLPLPVWGWADAGETITVELAGHTAQAVAGPEGKWLATLPALPAGGPYTLVALGSATLTVHDILIGEVWLCSGQSNMEWPLSAVINADEEVAGAEYPRMRLFSVPKVAVVVPETDVDSAWQVCTPETAGSFSAVGYLFGRTLHQQLDVPVGLINSSWGGTIAEAWTSQEGLEAEPSLRYFVEKLQDSMTRYDELYAQYQADYKAWEKDNIKIDVNNAGYPQGWADPATPTADWPLMDLPRTWQTAGLEFSGIVWFRREVEIPAAWAGKDLTLSIGACDKSDTTYVNNVQVGQLTIEDRPDAWCVPRNYPVPAELVQAGKAVIAVRVFSNMYGGGITGPAGSMKLRPADDLATEPIRLAGDWRYAVEENYGSVLTPWGPPLPIGPGNANSPTVLYCGMIAPLIPYGIRGAIWYQGESNADRGYEYRTLFPTMISDWRAHWGQGEFPYYFVQLANFMAAPEEPVESRWAELREAQSMTLQLANTGMAVIIDIGEALDIHPKNKQDVGYRLALNALAQTYGKSVTYSGPVYTVSQIEGAAIRLHFDHLGGGLCCRGERLTGFAIAGADRKFVWADAVIDGDTVLVSSPQIAAPVAVRYGWADNPACNLYNAAHLPASPFRTDTWPPLDKAPVEELTAAQ